MWNERPQWLLCACVLALLAAPAWAARSVRVYEVTVPGTGGAVFAEAMRMAIVRATGDRSADDDPALQPLIEDARRYAQVVRPSADGTRVTFDGVAVDRALVGAGRNLWRRERPVVLVVLEDVAGAGDSAERRKSVELHAEARGLPIAWAGGPANWGNREAALAAARLAGAEHVLVARGASGNYEQRLWLGPGADTPYAATNWNGDISLGIDGAADLLAASSIGLSVQPELETDVSVTGIGSLRDYVEVSRRLNGIAGVQSLLLLRIGPSEAAWRVVVRGGDATVQSALAQDPRFNPAAPAGAHLSYGFRR